MVKTKKKTTKKTTKKISKKKVIRVKSKSSPKTIFERVENFERPFKPVIRARAVRPTTNRKMNIVLGNFLFFIILFILSNLIYFASVQEVYRSLFFILSLIFGCISLAFLIALLAFIFLRAFKR